MDAYDKYLMGVNVVLVSYKDVEVAGMKDIDVAFSKMPSPACKALMQRVADTPGVGRYIRNGEEKDNDFSPDATEYSFWTKPYHNTERMALAIAAVIEGTGVTVELQNKGE